MAFSIDFAEMGDIAARLRKDHAAVVEDEKIPVPDTGVPDETAAAADESASACGAAIGDAGGSFVTAIRKDAKDLANWLQERTHAVNDVILDFHAVDGAEGTKYQKALTTLQKYHVDDRTSLDKMFGKDSELTDEEGGYR